MAITEHRLRPEVVSDDYPGYIAQYLMIRKAGIRCTNNTPFISLPFYDTADEALFRSDHIQARGLF